MSARWYWRLQILMALTLAVTFAMPHVIHAVRNPDPSLILMFSTDDGQYQARIRAALLHRWKEVRNGMIGAAKGDVAPKGASPALQEGIVGFVGSAFGLHAPQATVAVSVLITPLIVFLLSGLLRAIGFSMGVSLLGTAAYVFIFLTPLQKPINMSLSLPYTVLTLLMMLKVREHPTLLRTTIAGVLLGLLPWTYFWGWTYAWAVVGWFIVLHMLFTSASPAKRAQTRAFLGMAMIAAVVASVYFIDLWLYAHGHPDFAETAARSTIIHSRWVESVPRFVLMNILLVSMVFLGWGKLAFGNWQLAIGKKLAVSNWLNIFPLRVTSYQPQATSLFAVASVLGAYTAMYQNFVHGVIFTFSSHYYPYVCLSALIALLWVINGPSQGSIPALQTKIPSAGIPARGRTYAWLRICVILSASIFLLAGMRDYRGRLHHMLGNYHVRNVQHLASAVRMLDDGRREVVLTDRVSAHAVTAWTDDDAVFTPYVRHVLVSDGEYAERYCLTELMNPGGPDIDWLAHEVVEVPREEDYALRRAQFGASCHLVSVHPDWYLRKYGVTKLLWNERLRPEWNIDQSRFMQTASGSGWSLWELI